MKARLKRPTKRQRLLHIGTVFCLVALSIASFYYAATARATGPLAAPLPSPIIAAQGIGSANANHVFVSRAWDFAQVRQGFNIALISPGDQSAITEARNAGLAVVLEFDYKTDFFNGADISARVNSIVQQVQNNPGTISGIWVADRLNEKYSGAQGLSYLAATGGVFHSQLPGVPVFVDVSNWELTCGQSGQSSCTSPLLLSTFQYETNAVLTQFYQSGYIDGMFIADNLQNNNASAQTHAWQTARALWPEPFTLVSRASQLSFADNTYTGSQATTDALKAAYITAPMQQGADGIDLWAWHQVFQGTISSFLNKDTSSNLIWQAIINGANSLGLTDITPPSGILVSPTSGSTAVNNIYLATTTADNVGVTHVDFYVDGRVVASKTGGPYLVIWDSRTVGDGAHTFSAKLFDAAGNSSTTSNVVAQTHNNGTPPPSDNTPPEPDVTSDTTSSTTTSTAAAAAESAEQAAEQAAAQAAASSSDTSQSEPGSNQYLAKVTVNPQSPLAVPQMPTSLRQLLGVVGGIASLGMAITIRFLVM